MSLAPRCLIINPINHRNDRIMGYYAATMKPFPPMGIAYLASVLEAEGWEVRLIDQYATGDSHDDVVQKAREFRPDVLGLSLLTTAAPAATDLSRKLRAALPKVPLIAGNIHATYFDRQWLERDLADAVCHQEGERTFLELARVYDQPKAWESIAGLSFLRNGEYVKTPPRLQMSGEELDQLPYPAWHLLDINYYASHGFTSIRNILLTVLATRGCPYTCDFCSQNSMTPKVRKRDLGKVLDEVEWLYERHGVMEVAFADAIFPLSKKAGHEFCDAYMARGLHQKVRWFTETRVDFVDDDLMRHMAEANLRMIMFGIESGSPEVLDLNNKSQSLEVARQAIASGKRHGVATVGLFIHGLPGETRETMRATRCFALETDPDFAKFNLAVPYPGSPFFENFSRDFSDEDFLKFSSWYNPRGDGELIYVPEGMTSKELLRIQHWSMFRFYARPGKVWRYFRTGFLDWRNIRDGGYALVMNLVQEWMGRLRGLFRMRRRAEQAQEGIS